MTFQCNYCPAQFKQPVDLYHHWEAEHVSKLKRYMVNHRFLKQRGLVLAPSAQEACERLGWRIGDCYVKEMK